MRTYLLTVLPLLALVLEPAGDRPAFGVAWWPGLRPGPAPYLALLLLSGTLVWSYAFGLGLHLHWVGVVEYLPSYLLLAAGLPIHPARSRGAVAAANAYCRPDRPAR